MKFNFSRLTLMLILLSGFIFTSMPRQAAFGAYGEDEWSVFFYGGRWSNNRIGQILQFSTRFENSYVWVAGISRNLHRWGESLLLEAELNAARHTGLQRNFELNAALNLRWINFPWDNVVNTSLSYGLGPSYAFSEPQIEQRSGRDPSRVLVFMPVEISFAPPERYKFPWEAFVRVHHRSGAYGAVSTARGSNIISSGLRYRF